MYIPFLASSTIACREIQRENSEQRARMRWSDVEGRGTVRVASQTRAPLAFNCHAPTTSSRSPTCNMVYKLSATLKTHTADVRSDAHGPTNSALLTGLQVRAVASPTSNLVLSASRDATAVAWTRGSSTPGFSPTSVFKAGSRYINSLTYIPPSADAPAGAQRPRRRCVI